MNTTEQKYYVYAWYIKSTNKIFHIGKGTGQRYLNRTTHRNAYFINVLNKYKDDVDVKIIKDNLFEQEAFDLERKLIAEYKEKGECKTNLHIGGCGGFPGNSAQRSKKLSDFGKTRIGAKNPMYGKTHTPEVRKRLSEANKGKKLSETHKQALLNAIRGRKRTPEEIEHLRLINKGKKLSKNAYIKMMQHDCKYKYEIIYNNQLVYWCLGHTKLFNYCKEVFNISRTIIEQIVNKSWFPKFNKHKHLQNLIINKIDISVSTNPDECKDVEWRLTPFEVRSNLENQG